MLTDYGTDWDQLSCLVRALDWGQLQACYILPHSKWFAVNSPTTSQDAPQNSLHRSSLTWTLMPESTTGLRTQVSWVANQTLLLT
jgi:hypothetical protein